MGTTETWLNWFKQSGLFYLSCVAACASWRDTTSAHSTHRLNKWQDSPCAYLSVQSKAHGGVEQKTSLGKANYQSWACCAESKCGKILCCVHTRSHAESRERMTQPNFLGLVMGLEKEPWPNITSSFGFPQANQLFFEHFTAGVELCAPALHCCPYMNQHRGVCSSSRCWCARQTDTSQGSTGHWSSMAGQLQAVPLCSPFLQKMLKTCSLSSNPQCILASPDFSFFSKVIPYSRKTEEDE